MGLLERTCEHSPSSFRLREFVALLQEEVNDEQHDAGADPLFFVEGEERGKLLSVGDVAPLLLKFASADAEREAKEAKEKDANEEAADALVGGEPLAQKEA